MGVATKTIEVVTCDICSQECKLKDRDIEIQVNPGDGRDVGPAKIYGKMTFCQPYGVSNGIICHKCKVAYLRKYINEIDPVDMPATGGE